MSEWQPSTEVVEDRVTAFSAGSLHDLFDSAGPAPADGDALPVLWHWLAFLPKFPQAQMSADGHPRTGGFLPPLDGRRRMYAGGKVSVEGRPVIGETLTRTSRVTDVVEKVGRSGSLLFVTVEHEVVGAEGRIRDRQDIVYKHASTGSVERTIAPDLDDDAIWAGERSTATPVLFRYSAITYNAHRIHYDRDYATGVEGYPGLVVHGPMQAMWLADAAQQARPGSRITGFGFRSVAPAFDGDPVQLRVRTSDEPEVLGLAAYSGGTKTMVATARFEGEQA